MRSPVLKPTPEFTRGAQRLALWLAALAIAAGLVSFAGWVLDLPPLADWDGDQIAIQPNTALTIITAGIGLVLLALDFRWPAALIGTVVFLVGGATLFQHVSGVNLGIDTLILFERDWGQTSTTARGRMGLPAATSLTLIGMALCLAPGSARVRRLMPVLGLLVTAITLLSLIGYAFGASALFTMPRFTAIALQTSMMLCMLGVGVVAALPEHEPMRVLVEDSAAGKLARQSLPFIIVMPLLLALLALQGQELGYYDPRMGTAVLVLLLITLLVVGLWRGVREARKAEVAMREADVRKDEFLATLAHELRNPLAPLSNGLELLKRDTSPAAFERAREMMERQLGHMVRLIDDLLDVSRISSGKLELRLQDEDGAAIVRHAVEAMRPMYERNRHTLAVNLPPGPIPVRADAVRLAQLFTNLLSNAIKFTPPGGHIRIDVEARGTDFMFGIADDGVGIPPDKLEHIFEMFAQVDGSLERTQAGLGIGLTLARRIAELHGGRIEVSSRGPGTGSTFLVRLPIMLATALQAPAVPERTDSAGKLRVLVVDDNRDSAESLALLLTLDGAESHTAYDGESGVESAVRLKPHAVLLDIGLPRLNGYDACREIRRRLDGHRVAIIALTGWGQDGDRHKSAEAGFDGHLVKPVDHTELGRILAQVPRS